MFEMPCVAFLLDSAGAGEWIVLFVVILIVVGPKRLPAVARKLGRTMEMFRRAADEFKSQIMTMDQEPPPTEASYHDTAPAVDADGVQQPPAEESSSGDTYNPYPGNEQYAEALNEPKTAGGEPSPPATEDEKPSEGVA